MKRLFILLLAGSCFGSLFAQNDVNLSASDNWVGYMNWFELSGAYVTGASWGVADLKTEIDSSANTITLKPNYNTFADNPTDPYWVDTVSNTGNKVMEATTYVEPGSTFNGNDLTFSGSVSSNTLDTNYTATFFIKALDPNNGYQDAFGGTKVFDLPASGNFSVSATAAELAAGLIIQYGFTVRGVNANPANEANLGSVVVTAPIASSTKPLSQEAHFSVYPNPADDILMIQAENFETYRVFNNLGQNLLSGSYTNQINISDLNPGQYFVEIISGTSKKTKVFIKK